MLELELELVDELTMALVVDGEAALALALGLATALEPTGGSKLRVPTARGVETHDDRNYISSVG